jgi:hypothetical protein
MAGDRPGIPASMKRSIRQRCGFGCIVCGLPLYEYDHIDGWANTLTHDEDRIVLLCSRHHDEKSRGLLPLQVVSEFHESPFNRRGDVSTPYSLWFTGTEYYMRILRVSVRRFSLNPYRRSRVFVHPGDG